MKKEKKKTILLILLSVIPVGILLLNIWAANNKEEVEDWLRNR